MDAEEDIEINLEYAGFWIRFAAIIIDSIIALVANSLIHLIFFSQDELFSLGWSAEDTLDIAWQIIAIIAFWIGFGATPGKMLLRLQIVESDTGGKIGAVDAIGRFLGYLVSGLPLFLGFIWIAFDRRKQGFHDKLASTVVVHKRNAVRFGLR